MLFSYYSSIFADEKTFEATLMSFNRQMPRIPWTELFSNEVVLKKMVTNRQYIKPGDSLLNIGERMRTEIHNEAEQWNKM